MTQSKLKLAEVANGRAAMLGCTLAIGLLMFGKFAAPLIQANSISTESIWWLLGIYNG